MGRSLPEALFGIRGGEGLRATLMFAYIFLVIASLMILKPVSNSLFLSRFGAAMLPPLFLLLALFAALAAGLYSRFTRDLRTEALIPGTTAASILALAVFRLLLRDGPETDGRILYAFYIWVSLFGVITGAQFWLLANDVFHVREAKRLFGFIGTGAIAGGIFGGYLTSSLAPRVRTENLLFACLFFLAISIVLFRIIWCRSGRHCAREERPRRGPRRRFPDGPLRTILGSRHLLYIAGITATAVIVANLVDFQYRSVASRMIVGTDELTAFFGFWMSTANLISLGIQVLLSGRVLRRLGVTASLFFLPAGILIGALSILLRPGLGSAVLIRLTDGGFKHSIQKSGVELLFLPIPSAAKRRVRAFVDLFVNNTATGLAGALLILLGAASTLSTVHIGVIIIILITVWFFLILGVRREYTAALRAAIERRSIDIDRLTINPEDASTMASLVHVLEGEDERQILFALQLLEDVHNPRLIPALRRLVRHPAPEIASRAIAMAHRYPALDLTAEIRPLAAMADDAVRVEAIHYLCGRADDMIGQLRGFREDPDVHVRGSAMVCAARTWRENPAARAMIDLEAMLRQSLDGAARGGDRAEAEFTRITAARIVGVSRDRALYPLLSELLEDESPEVVCAALESAGRTAHPGFLPALIRRLSGERTHLWAQGALAQYGEASIGPLAERLADPDTGDVLRRRIPDVLGRIGSRRAADVLLTHLDATDATVRMRAIRALNCLRTRHPGVRLRAGPIESRIRTEIETWRRLTRILGGLRRAARAASRAPGVAGRPDGSGAEPRDGARPTPGWRLLETALIERRLDTLERMFRLLGLRFPGEEMINAFFGVTSTRRRVRANAVEYLDNVLPGGWKRVLIPIVEGDPSRIPGRAGTDGGAGSPDIESCLRPLIEGEDRWLRACALHLSAELARDGFRDAARALASRPDPLAREAAGYYLERIGERG